MKTDGIGNGPQPQCLPPYPTPPISLRHISRTSIPRRSPFFIVCKKNPAQAQRSEGVAQRPKNSVESAIHSPTDSATGSPSLRDATWPRNPVSPRLHPVDLDHLHPRSTTVARSRALRVDMLVLDSTTRYRPSMLQHRYLNASLYSSGPNHGPQHRVAAVIHIQP